MLTASHRFINPLTPVTRKYLEVQKFADMLPTGAGESLATKLLSGSQSRTRTVSQRTHTPEPQPARPLSAMRLAPRVLPSAVQNQAPPAVTDPPPRPHSSMTTRPRLVAVSNSNIGSRPLSAHIVGHPPLAPEILPDRPRSVVGGWSQGLDLRRQQSYDNMVSNVVTFPSSEFQSSQSHGEQRPNHRELQRSTSVTSGQRDVNKAINAIQTMKDGNLQKLERQELAPDYPPRPLSTTSDRPMSARPRSVLSTRHNGPHNPSNRPISATSDTLESFHQNTVPDSGSMRPKSPLGPQRPVPVYPDRPPPIQAPTPRAIERPTVVYLPTSDTDTASRPRAQKTWSLRHQMELLNKRKKQEDAKTDELKMPPPPEPTVPFSSNPLEAATTREPTSVEAILSQTSGAAYTAEPEASEAVELLAAATLAIEPELVPAKLPEALRNTLQDVAPTLPVVFPMSDPAPETVSSVMVPTTRHNPAPKQQSVSSKGEPNAIVNVKPTTTAATTRSRTVSASMMPVRAPSRSANIQPAGFVPKRTIKSSITQPTKSQAARAQAVMSERSAAAAKLTTSISDKPSQSSITRGELSNKESMRTGTNGFKPTSKTVPPTTSEAPPRIREAPRKPPVPTVSSLVKTHAARREAGLATVKVRLGGAPGPSSSRSAATSRSKSQAAVSSKKVIRSVEANAYKGMDTVHNK